VKELFPESLKFRGVARRRALAPVEERWASVAGLRCPSNRVPWGWRWWAETQQLRPCFRKRTTAQNSKRRRPSGILAIANNPASFLQWTRSGRKKQWEPQLKKD